MKSPKSASAPDPKLENELTRAAAMRVIDQLWRECGRRGWGTLSPMQVAVLGPYLTSERAALFYERRKQAYIQISIEAMPDLQDEVEQGIAAKVAAKMTGSTTT